MLQTLARGLEMLLCFTPERPKLTLQQLAAQLSIPKGSAFRTADTLRKMGFLGQEPDSKRYYLGLLALNLANASLAAMQYPEVALPKLEELAADTYGSASMALLDGAEIVYIARASVNRVMSYSLSVGSRLPCHATSMGKLLLAYLPQEEYEAAVSGMAFTGFTKHTTTTLERLALQREEILKVGYALSVRELDDHLASAAAPVRDREGTVVAAINVAVAVHDDPVQPIGREVVRRLLEAAQLISRSLGYRPGAFVGQPAEYAHSR